MKKFLLAALTVLACSQALADEIGDVSTAFHFGGSDKIVIEVYDDPLVAGVSCYVSRAKTGGLKGTFGLAEDKSDASIACRQVGPISFRGKLPLQDDVFTARLSVLFKKLHIVRVVDPKRNTLVYLTYSDKIVDGSPKNSVTAVPVPASTPIPMR
jgi:CreA protein